MTHPGAKAEADAYLRADVDRRGAVDAAIKVAEDHGSQREPLGEPVLVAERLGEIREGVVGLPDDLHLTVHYAELRSRRSAEAVEQPELEGGFPEGRVHQGGRHEHVTVHLRCGAPLSGGRDWLRRPGRRLGERDGRKRKGEDDGHAHVHRVPRVCCEAAKTAALHYRARHGSEHWTMAP